MSKNISANARKHALELLAEFIEREGGEVADGLKAIKVWERGEVVSFDAKEVVVDVERHRGILGESYRPGHGMANRMDFWVRYTLDRGTDTISERELDARDGRKPKLRINHKAVADTFMSNYGFRVEPIAGSRDVRVREANTGDERRVRTLHEAENFAAQCVSGGWDRFFDGYADLLTSGQNKEHAAKIEHHAKAKAAEMIREIW